LAEGFEGNELSLVRDRDGGGGESAFGNRFTQNREGGRKNLVLIVESGKESWGGIIQGSDARWELMDLCGL